MVIINTMGKKNFFDNMGLEKYGKIFKKNISKKTLITLALLVLILLGYSALEYSNRFTHVKYYEGEYIGIAHGYHSDIKVRVKTDKYKILKIEIISHREMPVISEVVFKEIPSEVIRKNSTDVDIVSGATYTSNGFIKALDNAIDKARLDTVEEE